MSERRRTWSSPADDRMDELLAARQAQAALFGTVWLTQDVTATPEINREVLNERLVTFRTWRPPAQAQAFGRRLHAPRRRIPVVSALLAAGRELAGLHWRAICWIWRALEGRV